MADNLKSRVTELYEGRGPRSVRLRYALIAFDLATVAYFIATAPFPTTPEMRWLNIFLAVFIFIDLIARFWISDNRWSHLFRVYVIADILVLLSLVLDPLLHIDLTFLRILRGLRLGYSEYLLQDIRRDSAFFRENEGALVAALNLVVFVFATTSGVFKFFVDQERGVTGYVDALYYTITTLTTTGYGDLVPTTPGEKLVAVGIMVVGVSLFVNLARAMFLPSKVHHACPKCGLSRHDPDAVHCKHCGHLVRIETKGFE